MKLVIITQDEPLYFGENLDYFLSKMPSWVTIEGLILLDLSPFGKSESFLKRIIKTYDVFGVRFFIRYTLKFFNSKIFFRKKLIKNILKKKNIKKIKLVRKSINSKENLEIISKLKPDLIISIAANQIFKKDFLSLPKYGCLNLHSAVLPKYKGLMPTFWAMKNNEKEMGASVFFMDEGIDTGKILVQKVFEIEPSDSLDSLIKKNKKVGMDALLEAINLIRAGEYQTKKYAPHEGSYYSFPKKRDIRDFINAGKKFW